MKTVEKCETAEWCHIDTAPKNFSDILLFLPESDEGEYGNRVTMGYWEVDEKVWIIPGLLNNELPYPTHWMPLPKPPITGP